MARCDEESVPRPDGEKLTDARTLAMWGFGVLLLGLLVLERTGAPVARQGDPVARQGDPVARQGDQVAKQGRPAPAGLSGAHGALAAR